MRTLLKLFGSLGMIILGIAIVIVALSIFYFIGSLWDGYYLTISMIVGMFMAGFSFCYVVVDPILKLWKWEG